MKIDPAKYARKIVNAIRIIRPYAGDIGIALFVAWCARQAPVWFGNDPSSTQWSIIIGGAVGFISLATDWFPGEDNTTE